MGFKHEGTLSAELGGIGFNSLGIELEGRHWDQRHQLGAVTIKRRERIREVSMVIELIRFNC